LSAAALEKSAHAGRNWRRSLALCRQPLWKTHAGDGRVDVGGQCVVIDSAILPETAILRRQHRFG